MRQIRGMKVSDDEASNDADEQNSSESPPQPAASPRSDTDRSRVTRDSAVGTTSTDARVQTGENFTSDSSHSRQPGGPSQSGTKRPKLHVGDRHAGKPVAEDANNAAPHVVGSSANRQGGKSGVSRPYLAASGGCVESNATAASSSVDKLTAAGGELRTCARCYRQELTAHEFKKCKK